MLFRIPIKSVGANINQKKASHTHTTPRMGKMKDSSLLKWTQNNKNNKLTGSSEKKEKKNGKTKEEKKKNWLHTPENLTSGHIAYLVKVILFFSSPSSGRLPQLWALLWMTSSFFLVPGINRG